jgi:hypothetical protein
MRPRNVLFMAILLTMAMPSVATPITIVVTPTRIIVGTNQTDSGGRNQCKLLSGSNLILVKAQGFARIIDDQGRVVIESDDGMWRAISGATSLAKTEPKIIENLEDFAFAVAQSGYDSRASQEEILKALEAHVLVLVVEHKVPKLSLIDITFSGWPKPKATVGHVPLSGAGKDFAITWVDDRLPPLYPLRPGLSESMLREKTVTELNRLSKVPGPTQLAFAPPFDIFVADARGVRRLLGSPEPCEVARKAALQGHSSLRNR